MQRQNANGRAASGQDVAPAAPRQAPEATNDDDGGGDTSHLQQQEDSNIYTAYAPRSLPFSAPAHPADIVEPYSLSIADLPPIQHDLRPLLARMNTNALSGLQLESIGQACDRHSAPFHGDYRLGFFIGDGTGVGKGRQCAAVMFDSMIHGRRRHLWVSASSDLLEDAQRDFHDIGCPIRVVNAVKALAKERASDAPELRRGGLYSHAGTLAAGGATLPPTTAPAGTSHALRTPDAHTKATTSTDTNLPDTYGPQSARYVATTTPRVEGAVLFCTYSLLASERRFDEVMEWLTAASRSAHTFDGVIVFDECHRAKNLGFEKRKDSSKCALAVRKMQRDLPAARVVYASATGVSDIAHTAFMERLGLWGGDSSFRSFDDFRASLKPRGLIALEMLAVDLKKAGRFVARSLSFAGASFSHVKVALTPEQRALYDEAATLLRDVRIALRIALVRTQTESRQVWKIYWSTHQSFFRQLLVAFKVPHAIARARQALSEGHAVVLGLQTTGEAAIDRYMMRSPRPILKEFVSTCRETIRLFLLNHFPVCMSKKGEPNDSERPGVQGENRPPVMPWWPDRHYGASSCDNQVSPQSSVDQFDSPRASRSPDDAEEGASGPQNGGSHCGGESASKRQRREDEGVVVPKKEFSSEPARLFSSQTFDEQDREAGLVDNSDSDVSVIDLTGDDSSENSDCFEVSNAEVSVVRPEETTVSLHALPDQLRSIVADDGRPIVMRKISDIRQQLLDRLDALPLPAGVLDELTDSLGGSSAVAEMTGRRLRMERSTGAGPPIRIVSRGGTQGVDGANANERAAFMKGEKMVAIISDAASTGISLHADTRARNSARRVHLTLELPWAADKALQQLGRTHRSSQVCAPQYELLSVALGGDHRFTASIAERLERMGAITRGDRRANAGALDLSADNLGTKWGRNALSAFLTHASIGYRVAELTAGSAAAQAAYATGLLPTGTDEQKRFWRRILQELDAPSRSTNKRVQMEIRPFLNRLLGLRTGEQDLVFSLFTAAMARELGLARKNGTLFEDYASEVRGRHIEEVGSPRELVASVCHIRTFSIDRGLAWNDAHALFEQRKADGAVFGESINALYHRHFVVLAIPFSRCSSVSASGAAGAGSVPRGVDGNGNVAAPADVMHIYRPNLGSTLQRMRTSDFVSRYRTISADEAKTRWEEAFAFSASNCQHGKTCRAGPSCTVGRRIVMLSLLEGRCVELWSDIEQTLAQRAHMMNAQARGVKIVRITASDGARACGVHLPQGIEVPLADRIRTRRAEATAAAGQAKAEPKADAGGQRALQERGPAPARPAAPIRTLPLCPICEHTFAAGTGTIAINKHIDECLKTMD